MHRCWLTLPASDLEAIALVASQGNPKAEGSDLQGP